MINTFASVANALIILLAIHAALQRVDIVKKDNNRSTGIRIHAKYTQKEEITEQKSNYMKTTTRQFIRDPFDKYKTNPYDYKENTYSIPLKLLMHNKKTHYERTIDFPKDIAIPSFIITDSIPTFNNHYSDVLMVTGAGHSANSNDNQSVSLSFKQMYSSLLADPYCSLLYVDMGLNEEELKELFGHFEKLYKIQTKMRSNGIIAYRKIRWSSFPSFIEANQDHLPIRIIVLNDVLYEWKGIVGWIDAKAKLFNKFSQALTAVRHYGVFATFSEDNVQNGICEKHLHNLHTLGLLNSRSVRALKSDGNMIVFDYASAEMHVFLQTLLKCCYTEKCILPRECPVKQDKHVLSLLMHEFNIPSRPAIEEEQDNSLEKILRDIELTYRIRVN